VREVTGDRGKQPLLSTTKAQWQELMSYTAAQQSKQNWVVVVLEGGQKGRQHGPKTAGNLSRITHLPGEEQVTEENNPCHQQPKRSGKN